MSGHNLFLVRRKFYINFNLFIYLQFYWISSSTLQWASEQLTFCPGLPCWRALIFLLSSASTDGLGQPYPEGTNSVCIYVCLFVLWWWWWQRFFCLFLWVRFWDEACLNSWQSCPSLSGIGITSICHFVFLWRKSKQVWLDLEHSTVVNCLVVLHVLVCRF